MTTSSTTPTPIIPSLFQERLDPFKPYDVPHKYIVWPQEDKETNARAWVYYSGKPLWVDIPNKAIPNGKVMEFQVCETWTSWTTRVTLGQVFYSKNVTQDIQLQEGVCYEEQVTFDFDSAFDEGCYTYTEPEIVNGLRQQSIETLKIRAAQFGQGQLLTSQNGRNMYVLFEKGALCEQGKSGQILAILYQPYDSPEHVEMLVKSGPLGHPCDAGYELCGFKREERCRICNGTYERLRFHINDQQRVYETFLAVARVKDDNLDDQVKYMHKVYRPFKFLFEISYSYCGEVHCWNLKPGLRFDDLCLSCSEKTKYCENFKCSKRISADGAQLCVTCSPDYCATMSCFHFLGPDAKFEFCASCSVEYCEKLECFKFSSFYNKPVQCFDCLPVFCANGACSLYAEYNGLYCRLCKPVKN